MIDQNKQFSRAEIIALESRITEFQNLKAEFDTVQAEIEVLEDVDIEEQLVERENFDADFYMYLCEAKEILEQLVGPDLGIMAQKGSCAAENTAVITSGAKIQWELGRLAVLQGYIYIFDSYQ
nr:unnamed protein product [Callosobruchus analis]